VEDPRQLTDRLRQQWLRVRTQNRHLRRVSHRSDPAHVEPSVPSTRNTSGGACQCVNLGTNSKFDRVAVGLVGVNWGQLPTSTHPCFSLFNQLACPCRNSQIHEQVEPHGSATSHAIFSSVICPLSLVLVHTINRIANIKCQIETLFFTLLFT
jgi:hypothetical protein